jgi:toxin ParE1/3/4
VAPPATGLRLRYRAAAKLDIEEARHWYGAISPKLEERFAIALAETLSTLLDNPRAYREIEPQVRRALVPVFPYAVYYRLIPPAVTVLAVLHTSRHPVTWKRNR